MTTTWQQVRLVKMSESLKIKRIAVSVVSVILVVTIVLTATTISQVGKLGRPPPEHSTASTTIRTAIAAANIIYDTTLPGGKSNFAAQAPDSNGRISSGTAATYHRAHDDIAVNALQWEEPAIDFQTKDDYGSIASHPGSPFTVWVQINGTYTSPTAAISPSQMGINPNGYNNNSGGIPTHLIIQPAELIRMGVKTTSGDSFCVIIVADSSTGQVTGVGYQSISTEHTQAGFGADCGAEETDQNKWREMPNTPGTEIAFHVLTTPEGAQENPPNSLYAGTDAINN